MDNQFRYRAQMEAVGYCAKPMDDYGMPCTSHAGHRGDCFNDQVEVVRAGIKIGRKVLEDEAREERDVDIDDGC